MAASTSQNPLPHNGPDEPVEVSWFRHMCERLAHTQEPESGVVQAIPDVRPWQQRSKRAIELQGDDEVHARYARLVGDTVSIRRVQQPHFARTQEQSLAVHLELDVGVGHDRHDQAYSPQRRCPGDVAVLRDEAPWAQELQAGVQRSRRKRGNGAVDGGTLLQGGMPVLVLEESDLRPMLAILLRRPLDCVFEAPDVGLQRFRIETERVQPDRASRRPMERRSRAVPGRR